MSGALKNLRVLITRPKPFGELLCQKIKESGGIPIYLPTLDIKPLENLDNAKENLEKLSQYDFIIFVSQAAVKIAVPLINPIWPKNSFHPKIVAIGQATAKALLEADYEVSYIPETETSEGLLSLPVFKDVTKKKFMIICGENGRKYLYETLMQHGALVVTVPVYCTIVPPENNNWAIQQVATAQVDATLITSEKSLHNLQRILGETAWKILQSKPLLVLSHRLKNIAKQLGFNKIFLIPDAKSDTIVAKLKELNMSNEPVTIKPKRVSWRSLGILLSGLATVILIIAASYAYQQFLKIDATLSENITSLQIQNQQLQTKVDQQSQLISEIQKTQNNENKNTVLLVEPFLLVKMANTQLQYANNVPVAISLLQNADQQLQSLNNEKFLPLRKALASDIANLQAQSVLDTDGIFSQLNALSMQIYNLPFPNKSIPQTPTTIAQIPQEKNWWNNIIHEFNSVLAKIVVIHHTKNHEPLFISPEQKEFLYLNLDSKIHQAIWGLLHRNEKIYQSSLMSVNDWVKRYFLPNAPETQAFLKSLQQLQQQKMTTSIPNISASLQTFQNYIEHQ